MKAAFAFFAIALAFSLPAQARDCAQLRCEASWQSTTLLELTTKCPPPGWESFFADPAVSAELKTISDEPEREVKLGDDVNPSIGSVFRAFVQAVLVRQPPLQRRLRHHHLHGLLELDPAVAVLVGRGHHLRHQLVDLGLREPDVVLRQRDVQQPLDLAPVDPAVAVLGAVPSSRSRRISRRLSASFSARMLDIGKAMPPLLAKNLTKTRRKLLGPGN